MGLLQYANLGLTTDFHRAQRDVYNGLGDLYRHFGIETDTIVGAAVDLIAP